MNQKITDINFIIIVNKRLKFSCIKKKTSVAYAKIVINLLIATLMQCYMEK